MRKYFVVNMSPNVNPAYVSYAKDKSAQLLEPATTSYFSSYVDAANWLNEVYVPGDVYAIVEITE